MSVDAEQRTIFSLESPVSFRTKLQLVGSMGLPLIAIGLVAIFFPVPVAWWVLNLLFALGAGALLWAMQEASKRPETSPLQIRRAPMMDAEVQTALQRIGGQGDARAWLFDEGAGWTHAVWEDGAWLVAIRQSVIERTTAYERQFLLIQKLQDRSSPFSWSKSVAHGFIAAAGAWAASVNLWLGLAMVLVLQLLILAAISWRERSTLQLALLCDDPLAAVSAIRKFGKNDGIPGQRAQHQANELEKQIKRRLSRR